MEIAWLVYKDDDHGEKPEFWTTEPESWRGRVVQIVYAVIDQEQLCRSAKKL